MPEKNKEKLLFIINPATGNNNTDFKTAIEEYYKDTGDLIGMYMMEKNGNISHIKAQIEEMQPDKVIAVGGDGTIKMVAECLLKSNIPIGILPGGSANGMAKELGIPVNVKDALEIVTNGTIKNIHAVKVNDQLCIHLCDIGFNAFVVKNFESLDERGMKGYAKAAWKVLWENPRMGVTIKTDTEEIIRSAAMIVLANATTYGTGVVINPDGKLDDNLFEVIVVRKLSVTEILKMKVTHLPFNYKKTEVFKTHSLEIKTKCNVHFQVDGEYLGKVKEVQAQIIPDALNFIIPVK